MSAFALALLVAAAALHAGWNVLVKRAHDKYIFTWCAWAVGSIGFAPLLAFGPGVPRAAWPYAALSALAQAAYFVALTRAYTLGDFSLVYPLARGAAPALLALWAALLLGERPSAGGLLGLALLLLGLLMVGGLFTALAYRTPGQPRRMALSAGAIGAALVVALCISIYSVSDGAAMRLAPVLSYSIVEFLGALLVITPVVLWRYPLRQVAAEWRANWPRILAVGFLMVVTYCMVLLAYRAGHVTYAGALRELSVVFAALIGWRWLGEGFGPARVGGALLIFAGIVLIAVAG